MQDSKYLEQLRKELVELSPDFVHDEKNIKNLISHMLSHKIKVQQNTHFKDQLADRLSRHIAWKSNPENTGPAPTLATSWLARLVMYGLPSLALCAAVLYTIPRSPSQTFTPVSLQGISQSQQHTDFSPSPISDTSSQASLTKQQNIPTSAYKEKSVTPAGSSPDTKSPLEAQQSSSVSSSSPDSIGDQNQQTQTTDEIPMKNNMPIVGGSPESSSMDMMVKTSSPATTDPSSHQRSIEPSATLQEWKIFAKTIEKLLPVTIEIHEDGLLDCVVREGILCTVLPDWALTKEHKLQLFDEIIKNISPDTMSDEKKNELKKTLGLE